MCPPPPWKTRPRLVWDVICTPDPAWSKGGESLARCQRCGDLVTHKVSSACLRLWGNSQHSLVLHPLHLGWGLSAPVHQHTLGVLVHGGSGEAAVRCLPAGVAWLAVPRPQIGFVDR